jgi:HD-like signal output (HDOD) protein
MTFFKELHALLRSGKELPTLPMIVFRLHAVLEDETAGGDDVASVIESDPALTARLLRVANSAAVANGGARVASVPAAVQRIGIGPIRSLCLVLGVVHAFDRQEGRFSHDEFWAHSAAVGAVTRLIWQHANQRGDTAIDDLYVAGLLHDVGLLMLDQFFPEAYERVANSASDLPLPWWQHEEDVLGMEHGDIGGLLLAHWQLPGPVVDGVAYHHRIEEAPETYRPVALAVHAAELICSQNAHGLEREGSLEDDSAWSLTQLGVAEAEIPALIERARREAESAAGLLV